MYILFFVINLIFAALFFLYPSEYWWPKIIESIFFLIIWALMFFYFSPFYFWKNKESEVFEDKISLKEKAKKIIPMFQKLSYIIAFLFFYSSLYWISYSFWGSLFPYFTLAISSALFIIFLSFLKNQKMVANLIFRSNFMVFSFINILLFVKHLAYSDQIEYIFTINSSLSLIWMLSTLVFDNLMEKYKKNAFYVYFLTYLYFFAFFYIRYYFHVSYYLLGLYLWFILWVMYFDFLTKWKKLAKYDVISKYYWIFLNYIVCLFALVYLFIWDNIWAILLILIWQVLFHFVAHYRFKNYISFVFVLLSLIFLYTKIFMPLRYFDFLYMLFFIYLLPFVYIWYSYVIKNFHEYDNYFIHFLAIFFSVISIMLYFGYSKDFEILHISVIFLLQSILLFWSFVKLKSR